MRQQSLRSCPNITQAESLPKSPQLWSPCPFPHTIHPPNFVIFLSPSSQPELPLIFLSKVHQVKHFTKTPAYVKHFTKTPGPSLCRQFAFSGQIHTVKLHRTLSRLHPPLNPSFHGPLSFLFLVFLWLLLSYLFCRLLFWTWNVDILKASFVDSLYFSLQVFSLGTLIYTFML